MQTKLLSEHRSSHHEWLGVSQGYLERNRGTISLCTLLWCPETCYQLIQAEQSNNPPAVFAFGSGSCEIEGRENIDPCRDGMTPGTNVRISLNPWTSAQMLFFFFLFSGSVCRECMHTQYDGLTPGALVELGSKAQSMFSIHKYVMCPSATFSPLSPDTGKHVRSPSFLSVAFLR